MEILRRSPQAKVLIVESSETLGRRVGESTVEISTFFLERVLGLRGELNRHHISKQGLRFLFANEKTRRLQDCGEVGPKFNTLFPGYQIDRGRLDEVVLAKAVARGAKLLRPAKVKDVQLVPGGRQILTVSQGAEQSALSARWVVDASGVRALVSRKQGWFRQNDAHPTAAAWGRWEGVTEWDDPEVMAECPKYASRVYGVRNNATNHVVGLGWWAWFIPLKDGDVSVGVVYDQRLTELPPGPSVGERLRAMICQHPAAERLLRGARIREGDVHFRRNLAYSSDQYAQDGVALVGDAGAFIDPFYSPGLDWLCYSSMATAKLVAESLASPGQTANPEAIERHNRRFAMSYRRWFDAIYRDKYYYMGDFDLMQLAFRLDLGFYYLGVVARPFLMGAESLTTPSFGQREAKWPGRLIAFYNRRLASLARRRIAAGRWGCHNDGANYSFFSYRLNYTLPPRLIAACAAFAWLELTDLFANAFARRPAAQAAVPSARVAAPRAR